MGHTLVMLALGCAAEFGVSQDLPEFEFAEGETPLADDEREDVWIQTISPASDVLFVVDNSCSMADEQAELADNFAAFLEALLLDERYETDFHVGVVSTDMNDPEHQGRLRVSDGYRWIDLDTPDPDLHFARMVDLGTEGYRFEKGRSAAFAALETAPDNEGFLRTEANLHVVVVSDEDDESDDISRDEFVEYLRGLKVAPFDVAFSSVVGPEGAMLVPFAACSAEHGVAYLEITQAVGGLGFSICKRDWGPLLAEIGRAAAGLETEFYLHYRPVPASIRVTIEVDGEPVAFEGPTSGVLYRERENKLEIVNYVPPADAVIRIRYVVAR